MIFKWWKVSLTEKREDSALDVYFPISLLSPSFFSRLKLISDHFAVGKPVPGYVFGTNRFVWPSRSEGTARRISEDLRLRQGLAPQEDWSFRSRRPHPKRHVLSDMRCLRSRQRPSLRLDRFLYFEVTQTWKIKYMNIWQLIFQASKPSMYALEWVTKSPLLMGQWWPFFFVPARTSDRSFCSYSFCPSPWSKVCWLSSLAFALRPDRRCSTWSWFRLIAGLSTPSFSATLTSCSPAPSTPPLSPCPSRSCSSSSCGSWSECGQNRTFSDVHQFDWISSYRNWTLKKVIIVFI